MVYKEEALEFLGITKWHKLGYTGKGIKIMSDEKICEKYSKNVISPKGVKSKRSHGDEVMAHIKLVAPDAEHIAYPFSGSFGSDTYKCDCVEYIKNNNVHVFTTSCLSSSINSGKELAMQDCIDSGCIFFAAAGNDGSINKGDDTAVMGEARSDKYLAIGGIKPKFTGKYDEEDNPIYDWDNLYKVGYSSEGKELDYVTVAEIMGVSGTSFCSPVFAGMVALVQQFFLEKAGRTLTREEMITFINDNLIDTDIEGFDIRTGYGLFILPEPSEIRISNYVTNTNIGIIDYGGIPEIKESNMFNQNNYGNIPYPSKELPNATVKSGGCGLCCSANVLQHFGIKVDIKALAEYFCDAGIRVNGGTDMQKASEYIKALVKCEVVKTNSEEELKKYLSKGAIAIANIDGVNNIFSSEGHFVNVIGINDDMFTVFDVGYYEGKFDSEYRRKYVTVGKENGNVVQYCKTEVLNLDTKNRNPNYYIFYKEEGGEDMPRYKTVEEMPEYYRKDIQELIAKGIIAGRGGKLGLDLSDDMCRMAIYAKKIFEQGGK